MNKIITDDQLMGFMLESNFIEGETSLNPNDLLCARRAISGGLSSLEDILEVHKLLTEHKRDFYSGGKWRTVNVRVGNYYPPSFDEVPKLMEGFNHTYGEFGSWKTHNDFEQIHPFEDFNGRMGRLIWLSLAVNEGYNFTIPFLRAYYYQTLHKTKYA